jgi:hypothetical protein
MLRQSEQLLVRREEIMAGKSRSRNPFLAWWIGLAITAAAVAFVGYQFTREDCGPNEGSLAFIVLGVIPAVYLSLMYLTLKSQAESERT